MESLKNKTNPWEVENLDEYLNYCCPECDHKSKTKGLFISHAFSSHPEAKDNLKYEECSEEIIIKSDITIKEEYIEDSKNENLGEFNEQILDWYEPELIESSKKPQKKKPTKQKKSKGIKKPKFPDHSVEDIKGPLQCYRCGDIFKSLK